MVIKIHDYIFSTAAYVSAEELAAPVRDRRRYVGDADFTDGGDISRTVDIITARHAR